MTDSLSLMISQTLRIATRQSPLALWQAQFVRQELLKHWPDLDIQLLPIVTSGDRFLDQKLLMLGGKGLFVKELEEALLKKEADCAVHSMKDVPAYFPSGLMLAAMCARDNPFDALISTHHANFHALPHGASIGTSSLRRQSQLLAVRPDLRIVPVRGNIQTRIHHLTQKKLDAIVLAQAGLERMGLDSLITETFDTQLMLPACGQGALGIECREDDQRIHTLLAPIHDPDTALCVQTERHVNALLGGNCHVPVAVYCHKLSSTHLALHAKVASADGACVIQDQQKNDIPHAPHMAETCARMLLEQGAVALLQS